MSRLPINRCNQLSKLITQEVIEGYIDGRNGEPEPGDNRSYSYWHGWRNGAADGGHRPIDQAQRELCSSLPRNKDGAVIVPTENNPAPSE